MSRISRGCNRPITHLAAQPVQRPPLPPFTRETAAEKVRLAEDAWNSRDPERVSLAYSVDSRWRNRAEIFSGRDRVTVRFAFEWRDDSGNWYRSYGNENWEFDADGLMRTRHVSINDVGIEDAERLYRWPLGRRPDDHAGLTELGLRRDPNRSAWAV